jgi:hypothetical protein
VTVQPCREMELKRSNYPDSRCHVRSCGGAGLGPVRTSFSDANGLPLVNVIFKTVKIYLRSRVRKKTVDILFEKARSSQHFNRHRKFSGNHSNKVETSRSSREPALFYPARSVPRLEKPPPFHTGRISIACLQSMCEEATDLTIIRMLFLDIHLMVFWCTDFL